MKIGFFERGNLIATGTQDEAVGSLLICPWCGENWGQVIPLNGERVEYFPDRKSCPECYQESYTGFYQPLFTYPKANDYWQRWIPKEVYARDFLLLCDKLCQSSTMSRIQDMPQSPSPLRQTTW